MQNDPDQYTIGQIMQRLKHGDSNPASEDGELVIRADGTQAIRVRKRKRRTHQPHKEEALKKQRIHMLQISAVLILLLLLVLGFAFAVIFANSGFFRKGLIEKITTATGAEVKLEQFRMSPRSANSSVLELAWPHGGGIQRLIARGLCATVYPRSFLGGRMTGEEAIAQQAIVWLSAPGQEVQPQIRAKDTTLSPVHFARLAANKCDVFFGDPQAPTISLKDSEISYFPRVEEPAISDALLDNDSGFFPSEEESLPSMLAKRNDLRERYDYFPSMGKSVPRLLANRGELTIKGWPKLQVDRAQLEFVDGMVKVLGLRLYSEKDPRGMLEFFGKVYPYVADQESRLSVVANNFPLEGIAGAELGKIFSGRIESDPVAASELLLDGGSDGLASMALSFRSAPNSSLALHGLPFLKLLSNLLNDDWFEYPVFTGDTVGMLRCDGAGISIADMDLLSRERMAVRGSIRYGRERVYQGVLEIGVASTVIMASGNRRLDLMFGPPKGNFRWVSLNVSGTASSPSDDFERLYDAAGRGAEAEAPAKKAPSFQELTRPE